jgi:hypothetical protein
MKKGHQHDAQEEKENKNSRILKKFPALSTRSSKPGQLEQTYMLLKVEIDTLSNDLGINLF